MRPTIIPTVSSVTTSQALPVDWTQQNFDLSLSLVITGSGTYKVQFTFDNIQDSTVVPTWQDHPIMTGVTATTNGNIAFPVRAVRLNCTVFASGGGTLTVLQGRK